MTKKHYEAIAAIINDALIMSGYDDNYNGMKDNEVGIAITLHTMSKLAAYFEKDNKLFNREKFIAACKMSQT